ncbi:MAG: carbon storage regulator [Planctomycetia bacterium]|nr:carbon storage regulator [Planctomycetia bacterium]
MLVLTRKNRESVVIGEPDGTHVVLEITVLEIEGGRVRLGFEADNRMPIHRREVWDRICNGDGNGNGNGNGKGSAALAARPTAAAQAASPRTEVRQSSRD